jgi:tetratricopeptide (TPR) repeat protein
MNEKQEKAEKLMELAFDLLEKGKYAQAIKTAKKLKEMRHSSNFEIMALAYQHKGDIQKAISVLEEGVEQAPNAWSLWQLLGNLYSDKEFYDKSQKCYTSALTCSHVNSNSIYLNSSIAYQRDEKYTDALNAINHVTGEAEYLKAISLKIEILAELERYTEAEDLAQSIMNSESWSSELYDQEDLSSICSSLSMVYHKQKNFQKAMDFAWKAIQIFKGNKKAAWLIRDIEGNFSSDLKSFRLMIEGVWNTPFEDTGKCPGFFTNYDVVAEDQQECLSLIKRFEPAEVRDSIEIREAEILQASAEEPKGVYGTSGYFFFDLDT